MDVRYVMGRPFLNFRTSFSTFPDDVIGSVLSKTQLRRPFILPRLSNSL